jgi:hypothetical protein
MSCRFPILHELLGDTVVSKGAKEPTKYWFATLADDISLYRLVDYTKLRWRIERQIQAIGDR